MFSGSSKCVLKSEELCYIKFFYSLTGLERSTTREDQMEMISTGRMCLISGWNFVTRYGVCSQKIFIFFTSVIVHLFFTNKFNFTETQLHQRNPSINWQKKKLKFIYSRILKYVRAPRKKLCASI